MTAISETPPGERLLWLTDTWGDKNGVSTVLKAIHREICSLDLPIDILVCNNETEPEDHLIVMRPVSEFTFPVYRQQPVRIPNYWSLLRIVRRGKYNRVICSTEGPMGWGAKWIGSLAPVEVSFFLHTDWLAFARDTLGFESSSLRRLSRLMRLYYRGFKNVFVLNTEQQQWLTGPEIRFRESKVKLTAHWPEEHFRKQVGDGAWPFPFERNSPVLLYAGRISKEKGVFELPAIFSMIREVVPEIKIVIAGTGPAEAALREQLPEAFFTGWIDHEKLAEIYRAADLMIFPSRFDTFSCVVLESLSCGTPVVAYNTKGPRDILGRGDCGYLAETPEEMAGFAVRYFLDGAGIAEMRRNAMRRSEDYQAGPIMQRLMYDLGMTPGYCLQCG